MSASVDIRPECAPLSTMSDGGATARYLKDWHLKHVPVSSWANSYHKPYADDWKEATAKAKDRMAKDHAIDIDTKKYTYVKPEKQAQKAEVKIVKEATTKETIMEPIVYRGIENNRKSYVVIDGCKDKEKSLKIANKYFKAKADQLEVISVWIFGDDLYIDRPNNSAKKAYAVVRKAKK